MHCDVTRQCIGREAKYFKSRVILLKSCTSRVERTSVRSCSVSKSGRFIIHNMFNSVHWRSSLFWQLSVPAPHRSVVANADDCRPVTTDARLSNDGCTFWVAQNVESTQVRICHRNVPHVRLADLKGRKNLSVGSNYTLFFVKNKEKILIKVFSFKSWIAF